MPLSDTAIRNAKPAEKTYKLSDSAGLYLQINPNGSKLWRFKYRYGGKEKKLALGAYPDVPLKEARAGRDNARAMLASGRDPSQAKRLERIARQVSAANSFEAIALEYIEKMEKEARADTTVKKTKWFLSLLKPDLGARPISEISPQELLATLRKAEQRGHRETASRLRSFASRIFRYGIATARANLDPAQMLRGALLTPQVKGHAAILDPKQVGELLRAIDGYHGQPATLFALKLSPHVFQRPGEVRSMEWAEIDLDAGLWTIPAARMKMRHPHRLPLSRQSVAILREIQTITGDGRYVFPSVRSAQRPMSGNTINGALRRLGYSDDEMTAHGFRSTASTLLNESGKWSPDAIERALAHKDRNDIRATYNFAEYWEQRAAMAQWWSDYLDTLRKGAEILPFSQRGVG